LWLVLEWLTAAVADMQDVDRIVFNREENLVHVACVAVEQMAHFERETVLSGDSAHRSGN
jgi:hypothetical protein